MSEVFISYAHEDEEQARRLLYELAGAGLDVWYDKVKLEPGQDWRLEIGKAIREAKIFIVCLSSRSGIKRGFVQSELRRALDVLDQIPEGDVFLVPVRLDACDVPERLKHLQYVDAFEDGAIPQLVSSITNRLRGSGQVRSGVGPLMTSLVRIDASDLNWGEVPLPDPPELFGTTYVQFFKLIEFVHGADLTLDITLENSTSKPITLSRVGVEVIHVEHVIYCYGIPTAAKVMTSDYFELEMPDIFHELRPTDHWDGICGHSSTE